MQIIPNFNGMPMTLNGKAIEPFEITDAVSMRTFVMICCDTLKSKGRNQRFCSGFFTSWFKEKFPHHNFTDVKQNSPLQNKIYNNIRKAISDYWKRIKVISEDNPL